MLILWYTKKKIKTIKGEEMPQNHKIHVIFRDKNWIIKKENCCRATKIHKKKEVIVKRAMKLAKKEKGAVVIHKKDGTVQKIIK